MKDAANVVACCSSSRFRIRIRKACPINMLVRVEGTPLADEASIEPLELVRTIATARIIMPASMVRLSAGRLALSEEAQALCFLAGANSDLHGRKASDHAKSGSGRRPKPARQAGHAVDAAGSATSPSRESERAGHRPHLKNASVVAFANSRRRACAAFSSPSGIDLSSNDYLGSCESSSDQTTHGRGCS